MALKAFTRIVALLALACLCVGPVYRIPSVAPRMPFNPLPSLEKGEWAMFSDWWDNGTPQGEQYVLTLEVREKDAWTVTILTEGEGGGTERAYPACAPPWIEQYLSPNRDDPSVSQIMSVRKEVVRLLGRDFDCTRFTLMDGKSYWLSPEVPFGVVAIGRDRPRLVLEGYGHDWSGSDWGASDETPLPVDPYARAREGDWGVAIGKGQSGDRPALTFLSWTIDRVDGDEVHVTVSNGDAKSVDSCRSTFHRGAARTFQELLGETKDRVALTGTEEGDEFVGGRTFHVRRFTLSRNEQYRAFVLSLSDEVSAPGLVSMKWCDPGGRCFNQGSVGSYELAGYGTAAGTIWGKTIDGVRRLVGAK